MSYADAAQMLETTSRTFYIPIMGLPAQLKEAVMSAYLCLRAIDEIEDHPQLPPTIKRDLLRQISQGIQSAVGQMRPPRIVLKVEAHLKSLIPEVSARISDWLALAPAGIAPRIWEATAAMADRMAYWVEQSWRIREVEDLDSYTFSVAGSVGLLLSDLWAWHTGIQTDRSLAVGFGRGLQTVNILRNREEDLARAVDFFPPGWTRQQMHAYASHNLKMAMQYTDSLPKGPVRNFCRIPLALATATLDALIAGKPKLSRTEVMQVLATLALG